VRTGRLRVTLGARIAATIALVVLFSTVAVTFAAYELERSGTESRFVTAADAGATSDLQQATAALAGKARSKYAQTLADYLQQRSGIFWLVIDPTHTPTSLTNGALTQNVPAVILQLQTPGDSLDAWTHVGGTRMLAVGGPVARNVTLVEFYDFSPVEKQLARLRSDLTRLDVAGLLLAVLIGIVVATQVSRPIRRAADAARRLGDGELDTRIAVHGRDELAELATSFNQMAQRLSETLTELRTTQTQQRRFVSDVSHELRTPLAAMLAAGETLATADPELRQRAATLLSAQTRRMSALVEELLEISRFDAGQAVLESEDVDLESLVRDAIRTVAPDDDVRLTRLGEVTVQCDPRRVHTILRNLVGNAVQHGGEPVDVIIDGRENTVSITVADSGPGIAPELVPVIFDRFVRADTSRTTSRGSAGSTGSTGLGLAIAYENALLHGAQLSVSTAGRTAFTLTIPRLTTPSAAAESLIEAHTK
jgi:two-component system, OmpR family, sensor histidine kinase MtrB